MDAQMARARGRYKRERLCYRPGVMRRLLPFALSILAACTFGGSGIAPFTPAPPAHVAEEELDVPYVPTPRPVVEAMLDMAAVLPEDYLIDLGSGDGRIAIMAAQRGARALGVDIDPDRVAEAVLAARVAQVETRALFRRQDLFDTPLRDASVVTMYLLPDINMRLRPRLLTELRPGTRIVSHNFTLGDWRPDAEREIDASHIYLWVVPATAAGRWSLAESDGSVLDLELEQRFQDVTGTLGGSVIEGAVLRGRTLRFTAGGRLYEGEVGDAEIVAADGGWRARRTR
jgi:SAM-dependent methyltransferase